jgi:dihydroxyacetone kinase
LAKVLNRSIDGHDVITSVIAIASAAEDVMGGTSGALYSYAKLISPSKTYPLPDNASRIFFSGLAQGLQAYLTQAGSKVTPPVWAQAAKFALNKLYHYTHARPPSRTLMDPLAAFATSFSSDANLHVAVRAAEKAAEGTKDLEAKAGRSAYIEGSRLKELQIPDPGAWGVKVILENLIE